MSIDLAITVDREEADKVTKDVEKKSQAAVRQAMANVARVAEVSFLVLAATGNAASQTFRTQTQIVINTIRLLTNIATGFAATGVGAIQTGFILAAIVQNVRLLQQIKNNEQEAAQRTQSSLTLLNRLTY